VGRVEATRHPDNNDVAAYIERNRMDTQTPYDRTKPGESDILEELLLVVSIDRLADADEGFG
jgi:hypothetical protein